MKHYSYQIKELILAIVILVPLGIGLTLWGHDPSARYTLLIGGAFVWFIASIFILATHRGPKHKSWLGPFLRGRRGKADG